MQVSVSHSVKKLAKKYLCPCRTTIVAKAITTTVTILPEAVEGPSSPTVATTIRQTSKTHKNPPKKSPRSDQLKRYLILLASNISILITMVIDNFKALQA